MMKNYYAYKVWLAALIASSLAMVCVFVVRERMFWSIELIYLFFYFLAMAIAISVPTFLLFLYACKKMTPGRNMIKQKLFLCLLSIAGITFTLYCLMGKDIFLYNNAGIAIPGSFAISIITAIFLPSKKGEMAKNF
jgi:hypothetical protein